MRRRQWFEIHDQAWFPKSLRDLMTDTLQFVWNFVGSYNPVVPYLRHALGQANTHRILDICSGGGGPWASLIQYFETKGYDPLEVRLTDRFPHTLPQAENAPARRIHYHSEPVNATRVPNHLEGFRTLFTSFHHFPPEGARAILRDAVDSKQGVGIFELPRRDWRTILLVLFVPLMAFALVPFIRPFRWSRLLWTFVIPVIPFVVWFDGVISCLRAYTPSELRTLVRGLSAKGYRWEIGETKTRPAPLAITYLIGYPVRKERIRMRPLPPEQGFAVRE